MMHIKLVILLILGLTLNACCCNMLSDDDGGAPSNAAIVELTANTSLTPWLEQAIKDFNDQKLKTNGGKRAYVELNAVESGQAVADMTASGQLPTLWIPDGEVWASVLAAQGHTNFQGNCASVASSPLVIAMWRPVAEALGWPGRSLGWLDIGSLAADPSAWAYYSGNQFGPNLRLGHTHPGLSGSGTNTLLAIVQAAESKTEAVTIDDIQQPIVQASVSAFEGAVSWFSPATDSLAQTMRERGVSYLVAAVMYESAVLQYGQGDPEIVPIYPFEGTFVAEHAACVNGDAGSQAQQAAVLFRDYLLSQAGQQLAVTHGLRPVNEQATIGAPLDAAHGIDLSQPEIVFSPPSAETVYAVQDLWQAARKDVNLVMLLDTSGSMRGDKMESMRKAAVQFVEQMGDEDFITLIAFADQPNILVRHQQVGPNREGIIDTINGMYAAGNTALYDAIGAGAGVIAETNSSANSNAMVVLTDGKNNNSYSYSFDQNLINLASAHETTVFTIAYGGDAERASLTALAEQAKGNFYLGDEASIAAIYQEMSAAFGGSAGIGR